MKCFTKRMQDAKYAQGLKERQLEHRRYLNTLSEDDRIAYENKSKKDKAQVEKILDDMLAFPALVENKYTR